MMYVYMINSLFLMRLALIGNSGLRKLVYHGVLAGLFVFTAFRYEIGCDWLNYKYHYDSAEALLAVFFVNFREPLWVLTVYGVSNWDIPYVSLNIISSAIFFFGMHRLAKRQPDPLGFLIMLLPILIINIPMSGIRQGIAIGIIALALLAYLDGKIKRFVFWVVVAFGFHTSAILAIGFLPFILRVSTATKVIFLVLLGIPMAYFFVSSSIAQLAITRYVTSDANAVGAIFRIGVLMLTALYFMAFLRRPWKRQFPVDYQLARVGALVMLGTFVLVPFSSVIADRLGYYLFPIQAMIFARIPYLSLGNSRVLQSVLPYIGLIAFFLVWSSMSHHFNDCYVPYRTWMFGIPRI